MDCEGVRNAFMGRGKYKVTKRNGKTEYIRMEQMPDGEILLMAKRSRKTGYRLSYMSYAVFDWKKMEKVNTGVTTSLFIKHIKDAVSYMENSGLWSDIKADLQKFLDYGYDFASEFLDDLNNGEYETYKEVYNEDGKYYGKVKSFEILTSLAKKSCWKSIPFNTYERDEIRDCLSKAIDEKKDYAYWWVNGYDNRVEVKLGEDGKMRGWLSCEYRNCGNGHYYLLFDNKHAIFYTDD